MASARDGVGITARDPAAEARLAGALARKRGGEDIEIAVLEETIRGPRALQGLSNLTRKAEVEGVRIACTGLPGGGFRLGYGREP